MKNVLIGLCFLISVTCLFVPSASIAFNVESQNEIPIYDKHGNAVAYIARKEEQIVYLWSGEPVAHLEGTSFYRFNGQHIAWLENDIIWDHDGDVIGFTPAAKLKITNIEPIKGIKQLAPIPNLPEPEAISPIKSYQWSEKEFSSVFMP